jgi:hypothetical protein
MIMSRGLELDQGIVAVAIVIIVALGLIAVAVPIVPVKYQEEYQAEIPYIEQVPYTVQIPYQESVQVTRTNYIQDQVFTLTPVTWKVIDFTMPQSELSTISWGATKQVLMFAVLEKEVWDRLYGILIVEFGLSIILSWASGGTLTPAIIAALPEVLLTSLVTIATSGDYYKINSMEEMVTKDLRAGPYKLVIFSFGETGSLWAKISYDYSTTEMQTRFREEIRYREETRYRNETRYKTVNKVVTILSLITGSYLPR